MADSEIAIDKEKPVFTIKVSLKYEKNLQAALNYSLQNWGAVTIVNFHLQVIKEIYVITYHIDKNTVKVINILYTSRNPIRRKAKQ